MEAQLKITVPLRKTKKLHIGIVLLGASYCQRFTIEERFLVDDDAEIENSITNCEVVLHFGQVCFNNRSIKICASR